MVPEKNCCDRDSEMRRFAPVHAVLCSTGCVGTRRASTILMVFQRGSCGLQLQTAYSR